MILPLVQAEPEQHACFCDFDPDLKSMISVKDAKAAALSIVPMIKKVELVDLASALGRITASDIYAPQAMPFFNNSAMDGYVVRVSTFMGDGPWKFKVGGILSAGDNPVSISKWISERTPAIRIFTGAPVPDGFDAVIPQENCEQSGNYIIVSAKPNNSENIRQMGSDIARGERLISAGTELKAHHIGILAANGHNDINVFQKPRVAILSTGDELVRPDQNASPGQIYDCNAPMLTTLFAENGIIADSFDILADDEVQTRAMLRKCANKYDLIVSSGSVSVGDKDFLKSAFESVGGEIINWKVAIKPGKPVMFGVLENTVFTGLPGNPFATFVGFHLFVKLQLEKMSGRCVLNRQDFHAEAGFDWHRKAGRAEVFPVKIIGRNNHGMPILSKLGNSVSATLYPLAEADGLAMVSEQTSCVVSGDPLVWESFSSVGNL